MPGPDPAGDDHLRRPGRRGLPQRRLRQAPRLSPAELGEAVLVDPEVVRDFVDDGDADLLHEPLWVVAELVFERKAIDRDLVRQSAGVLAAPFCQRDTEIEPEDIRVLGVLVLDDDLYVRHGLT